MEATGEKQNKTIKMESTGNRGHHHQRRPHFRIDWRELTFYQKEQSFFTKRTMSLQNNASNDLDYLNAHRKRTLNSLDGCFKSGQLSAILGPSGAGKTTFLSALFGDKQESAFGHTKVSWFADSRHQQPIEAPQQRPIRIAFLPQQDHLLHHLSVYETLMFASRIKNATRRHKEAEESNIKEFDLNEGTKKPSGQEYNFHKKNVRRVAKMLKLLDCFETRCGKLSGGQYKRVSIGQELLSEPDVIILDEPTSGLDAMTCLTTIRTLKSIVTRHPISIVLTIHQPDQDVFNLFDHVYVIAQGGMAIYEGPPAQVAPRLAQVGLTMPTPNYNPARFIVEIAFVGGASEANAADPQPEGGAASQRWQAGGFGASANETQGENYCRTAGHSSSVSATSESASDSEDEEEEELENKLATGSKQSFLKRSLLSLAELTTLGNDLELSSSRQINRLSPLTGGVGEHMRRRQLRDSGRRPLLNIGIKTADGKLITNKDLNRRESAVAADIRQAERLSLLRRLNDIQRLNYYRETSGSPWPHSTIADSNSADGPPSCRTDRATPTSIDSMLGAAVEASGAAGGAISDSHHHHQFSLSVAGRQKEQSALGTTATTEGYCVSSQDWAHTELRCAQAPSGGQRDSTNCERKQSQSEDEDDDQDEDTESEKVKVRLMPLPRRWANSAAQLNADEQPVQTGGADSSSSSSTSGSTSGGPFKHHSLQAIPSFNEQSEQRPRERKPFQVQRDEGAAGAIEASEQHHFVVQLEGTECCKEAIGATSQEQLEQGNNHHQFSSDSGQSSGALCCSSSSQRTTSTTGGRTYSRRRAGGGGNGTRLVRKFDKRLSAKHNCAKQKDYPHFYHALLLTHRTWLSIVRDPVFFGIQFTMHTTIPILLALIFGSRQEEGCPRIGHFDLVEFAYSDSTNFIETTVRSIRQSIGNVGVVFFEMFVLSFAINCITALVFPLDMYVLLKEYRNGWYSLRSYFFGRTLADLPVPIVLHSMAMVILCFMTGQPLATWRFLAILGIVILASLVAQSVGLTIGALLMRSSQSAVLAAAGIVAPFFALSGFIVRIHTLPFIAQAAANVSYLYHLLNGFILLRYGFGRCQCDEADFEIEPAHKMPPQLATMASIWIGTYSDEYAHSRAVTSAAAAAAATAATAGSGSQLATANKTNIDPNIDVVDKLMTAFRMANSYGRQIDSCEDVLPYAMLEFNLRDHDIWWAVGSLVVMLLVSRFITFSAIYYKIRSFS